MNHNHVIRTLATAAIVLAASIAGLGQLAYAAVDEVILNTNDREWEIDGYLELTVVSGSALVNGVPIGPGDTVTLVVDSLESEDEYLKVWIGSTGYVDIEADASHDTKLLVNGVEVASGAFTLTGVRIDTTSIVSTLTIEVDDEGWTSLSVDGNTIITGTDGSDIVISGITISRIEGILNLNTASGYLEAGAVVVEVNGQEVPWATPEGLLAAIAVLALAGIVLTRRLDR